MSLLVVLIGETISRRETGKTALMRFLSLLAVLTMVFSGTRFAAAERLTQAPDRARLARISPGGEHLLLAGPNEEGLFLHHLRREETIALSLHRGAAAHAACSMDGRWIAFKDFVAANGTLLQRPMLYDIVAGSFRSLHAPAGRAGTPGFSANGLVVFTVERTLLVHSVHGDQPPRSYPLPCYVNLAPISPDGRSVVYNDVRDQLWLLDLPSGQARLLTADTLGYFAPSWSRENRAILAQRMDGHIVVIDIPGGTIQDLGEGFDPDWNPAGDQIIFKRPLRTTTGMVERMQIRTHSLRSAPAAVIRETTSMADGALLGPANVIWYHDAQKDHLLCLSAGPDHTELAMQQLPDLSNRMQPMASVHRAAGDAQSAVYFDIPYLHQAYDTPDWFNGNWACGGTSAVMCLAYYDILPKWSIYVSSPERHISDYGRYVSDVYTYRDYSFNIGGADPNGRSGYGAYGYIIQNNWADTKGNMAAYARRHGVGSSVDWSPLRQEAMQEVDQQLPFVLLNSLTTSGHYISVIGYEKEATTLIVNDPWGDKNRKYPNNYGRRARYDWPGYNNGFSNLNTVHCFIYFRNTVADLKPIVESKQDTMHIAEAFTLKGKVVNLGWAASSATKASVVFSTNTIYNTTDIHVGELELPPLTPADTFRFEAQYTVPDSLAGAMYAVGVFVDSEYLNTEVEEGNNFAYMKKLVRGLPVISTLTPAAGAVVTETRPTISAAFFDRVSDIDLAALTLIVDGVDVSGRCETGARLVTYTPDETLSDGPHQVRLSVRNQWGYTAVREWVFAVKSAAAVVVQDREIAAFELCQAYPNPFNDATTLSFTIATAQPVKLRICDVMGRCVVTLVEHPLTAGHHIRRWHGNDQAGLAVASGLYFIRLETQQGMQTRRLLLLR